MLKKNILNVIPMKNNKKNNQKITLTAFYFKSTWALVALSFQLVFREC